MPKTQKIQDIRACFTILKSQRDKKLPEEKEKKRKKEKKERMAFSHRPTWHAARGGGSTFDIKNYVTGGLPSRHIHKEDLPSHAFLKFRQPTQGTKEEIETRDLETELRLKEKAHFEKTDAVPNNYGAIINSKEEELLKLTNGIKSKDGKVDFSQFDDSDDEVSSDDESDSEEEDDEAELLRELAKIKEEREEERKRKEDQEIRLEAKLKQVESNSDNNNKLKRRWNEDIVFRNQSRDEPKKKTRFINDTIRNDFHKRFLNRYIN